jgi:hypothetical protein
MGPAQCRGTPGGLEAGLRTPVKNLWRGVMHITSEDAVVMYARACRAWYGPKAPRVVAGKIEELRRAGDHSGVMAWSKVAEKLSQPIDSLKPAFEKRPHAPSVRRGNRHRGSEQRRG